MSKLWAGRTAGNTDKTADDFNSSLHIDNVMFKEDIRGSVAHATMLGVCGIIPEKTAENIVSGLDGIYKDIENGKISLESDAEDIHMLIEQLLTERIGDDGKSLHTARSRNDQVALDIRMFLRNRSSEAVGKLVKIIEILKAVAFEYKDAVMPGYTHLQPAQPITFGHWACAYAFMFMRDCGRFSDAAKRMNLSPLGSAALAGTSYPIDREMTASALGFDGVVPNSLDGVSDRDFCIELASAVSVAMMHLSRLAEEIILYTSLEFGYIELDDAYTTGSSIMPQKKNSDMAELVRGKTGRVYGDLITLLTMMKGLPLAYNKDMQEDKEAVFDSLKTLCDCLDIMCPMLKTMCVKRERLLSAAARGFINATDLADYLTKKSVPFRDAYKISGKIVAYCISNNYTLENLPLEKYKEYSGIIEADVFEAVNLNNCVSKRNSVGGTSPSSVLKQIDLIENFIKAQSKDSK